LFDELNRTTRDAVAERTWMYSQRVLYVHVIAAQPMASNKNVVHPLLIAIFIPGFPRYSRHPAFRPSGHASHVQNRSRRFCRGNDEFVEQQWVNKIYAYQFWPQRVSFLPNRVF
jgi:hypothetical protein